MRFLHLQELIKHVHPDDSVDLRGAVYALSDALDLVAGGEIYHGKRVGFIASQCAAALGYSAHDCDRVIQLGMLHDCGVSSSRELSHLIDKLEWESAEVHCHLGYRHLRDFAPLADFAEVILYHHKRWEELAEFELPPFVAEMANLIFLADRVDALMLRHPGSDPILFKEQIRSDISALSGTLFDPRLVEAFLEVSLPEAFWFSLESRHVLRYLWEQQNRLPRLRITFSEFKQLAKIFASIVDAKSRFTHMHSKGVAALIAYLASRSGFSVDTCERLEVTGLLHDLGKLRIPDGILDKPEDLNSVERALMRRHSFETYQILQQINGLEDIARWAGLHHEFPNGQGYPFARRDSEICRETRLLSSVDVFQALAQKRPYRDALPLREIMQAMWVMVKRRQLDGEFVSLINNELEICHRIALCKS